VFGEDANRISTVGYTAVALSQTVTGKFPADLSPPNPPANPPKSLTLLTRLNLTISDPSQSQRLGSLSQSYTLIAIRPTNEKSLQNACNNLECDLISLDLSVRLPYHFKMKNLAAAIARGIRLEICYGPGITGSGQEARRNLIGNAMALIRATRGRGIVVSSEARRALAVRAPSDVMNLACVWGLSPERGKEAVCEEARKVVAMASFKRTSWRGVVDVIRGGQKVMTGGRPRDEKSTTAKKPATTVEINGDNLKRKASLDLEPTTDDIEKPLSKRQIKRRAKKARLEAQNGDRSITGDRTSVLSGNQ
jgi:ribonuclease P/MRP protein subunit RPP1